MCIDGLLIIYEYYHLANTYRTSTTFVNVMWPVSNHPAGHRSSLVVKAAVTDRPPAPLVVDLQPALSAVGTVNQARAQRSCGWNSELEEMWWCVWTQYTNHADSRCCAHHLLWSRKSLCSFLFCHGKGVFASWLTIGLFGLMCAINYDPDYFVDKS